MSELPTNWYIQLTKENYDEVKAWWLTQVEISGWSEMRLPVDAFVLSQHPADSSYYWGSNKSLFHKWYPSYKEITLEQFRQITNSNQTPTQTL